MMRMKIIVVFFILIMFGMYSPEGPKSGSYTLYPTVLFHIEGVVSDSTNNGPIEGATITVAKWVYGSSDPYVIFKAETGSEGKYSINEYYVCNPDSPVGVGGISAEAAGYSPISIQISDSQAPRCTEELQIIDFQLIPIN